VEDLIKRVAIAAGPLYVASKFYKHTIWPHVLGVAKLAREFAEKQGANAHIAELGGLLHDIGAALFGSKDHHITGVKEATAILIECKCPLEIVGPIASTIYTHRGSQRIAFEIPEGMCVAAADAADHFQNVDELWLVHKIDLKISPLRTFQMVSDKLERDWQKTSSEIKTLLDGSYSAARQKLLKIANGDIKPRQRSASLIVA